MPRISYTGKDLELIRSELISQIPSLTNKWTDFNASDVGIALVELIAATADMLNYYIDEQFLECFLPTAIEKKNIKAITSLIGYKMRPIISATSTVKFSLRFPATVKFTIPRGTVLSSVPILEKIFFFTTNEDITLYVGDSEKSVGVTEGLKKVYELKVSNITGYRYLLPDKNIDPFSFSLAIDEIFWTLVEDVFLTQETGRYYHYETDKDDNYYLVFDPHWLDYVDSEDSSVDLTYNISSGSAVSLGQNVIDGIEDTIYDDNGNQVSNLTVTNTELIGGGQDSESVDLTRLMAPRIIRSMWVATTLADYDALANNYPGVGKAKTLDWNIPDSGIYTPWVVRVVAVGPDGEELTSEVEDNLLSYLTERKVTCVDLAMKPVELVTVDITLDVYINYGYTQNEITYAIQTAIDDFFQVTEQDFGDDVNISNLITLIETSSAGIDHIDLTSPTSNVSIANYQFPRKGTVTITFK